MYITVYHNRTYDVIRHARCAVKKNSVLEDSDMGRREMGVIAFFADFFS